MKKIYFPFLLLLAGVLTVRAQYAASLSEGKVCPGPSLSNKVSQPEQDIVPHTASLPSALSVQTNVYPNPSNGNYTVKISSPTTDKIKLQLVDVTGRIVWQNAEQLNEGDNYYSYSLQNQTPGTYLLIINGNTISDSKKLVIAG
jgi:hypothetical protein